MGVARRAGGLGKMQQAVDMFDDDGGDGNDTDMGDMFNDMKGMKPKDAKKNLRGVVESMNDGQIENFIQHCKKTMPSSESKMMVDYIRQQQRLKHKRDKNKPKVSTETVYTPYKERVRQQEVNNEAETQVKGPDAPDAPKKGKKGFGPVNIVVPKLKDLHRAEVPAAASSGRGAVDMDQSNPGQRIVSDQERIQALHTFSPDKLAMRMKNHLLNHGHEVRTVRLAKVELKPIERPLFLPGVKKDVYRETLELLQKTLPVVKWLRGLAQSRSIVPWDWLCRTLPEFGIVMQQQHTNTWTTFRLVGRHHLAEDGEMQSACPSFLKLTHD